MTPAIEEREGRRRIRRLLVANRGELVARIARTCAARGIAPLGLVAEDQAHAWWTRQVGERVPLEGSYLDGEAVIGAARAARADAIHPGYGFLAERAEFAEAVLDAGMTWVGPPPAAMRALGDKAGARRLAASLGVPTLPGYDGEDQDDETLGREAERIGFPVLTKPSAGGGCKGMHVVRAASELRQTLARARREAKGAFGDERLVLERYIERPRHVEIQLLVDEHGNAAHLGERDCSLQRRHQKVVEESPSPSVDAALRVLLGTTATRLALAAGYVGAGTVEFLLDEDGSFYFIELNARLQVEHPVTEAVTGRDLVADQLRIAAGEPLGFEQHEVHLEGHAVEVRIYAEDPWNDFLPAVGRIGQVTWPEGDGIRLDAGVGTGDEVGTTYDPLLAKLIVRAEDRAMALDRAIAALGRTAVPGVTTNRGWLSWLLALPEVRDGTATTRTIDERWEPAPGIPEHAWERAAERVAAALRGRRRDRLGFRLNATPIVRLDIEGEQRTVSLPLAASTGAAASSSDANDAAGSPPEPMEVDVDGRSFRARLAPPPTVEDALRHAARGAEGPRAVTATMPGTVLDVRVAEGDIVDEGQVLVVLEAMKMENAIPAPAAGRVARVSVARGDRVQRGDPLVEVE